MLGCVINGSAAKDHGAEANAAQVEYFRQELSALRAQSHTELARRHIELQQAQNSGLTRRAADVRRIIRALETELMTLERLGERLDDWP